MNKETFAKYISDPTLLNSETLPDIKAMLDEFPYFQSAWVLYIKNLHAIKDIRYESKLKTGCTFISDRKLLHDILKGTATLPQNIENQTVEGNIVQSQNLVSQLEENTEDISIVQTQNLASQPEENTEGTSFVQTQNIASQPEENTEGTSLVQTQNIVSQPEENTEDTSFVQTQNIASQSEIQDTEIPESSNPEPDKPESLADRILRQAEEMRKAKAAAATAIEQEHDPVASQLEENAENNTIVQTQNIASQPEENAESTSTVQTQDIASQLEENPEDTTLVQTQNLASQPEIQDTEIPKSSNLQIFESQNPEPEEPENKNIETEEPESSNLQIFESSNPEPEEPETKNIETEEPESSNLQIFESPNPTIDQSQIRELIERQLHSLGINANITFTGNSANIQFENITTDEIPEENTPEQPAVKEESPAEIQTTPSIEEQIEKRKNERDKKANLIDKFIESKARIVPKKDYHSDNKLSTESIIEDEELFTEQLAKIYIKQGHLEKALETYEKLYLKYPEKNIYFATRIDYVKRLIKNK